MVDTISNADELGQMPRSLVSDQHILFRAWRLNTNQEGVVICERTRSARVLAVLIMLFEAGWLLGAASICWNMRSSPIVMLLAIVFLLGSSAFMVVLSFFRPTCAYPTVFDRNQMRFWRQGHYDPAIGDYSQIEDIVALQVVAERPNRGEGQSPPIFESNLVMRHLGVLKRVSVMCHGNRRAMWEDARKLAEFLQVPLLDHTALPE